MASDKKLHNKVWSLIDVCDTSDMHDNINVIIVFPTRCGSKMKVTVSYHMRNNFLGLNFCFNNGKKFVGSNVVECCFHASYIYVHNFTFHGIPLTDVA